MYNTNSIKKELWLSFFPIKGVRFKHLQQKIFALTIVKNSYEEKESD